MEVFKDMFPRFQAFSYCLSSYNTETWPRKIVVIMYFAFKTYPGGGAFALFFHPHPREFATQNKKSANARGLARGGDGRSWNWLMHKDESIRPDQTFIFIQPTMEGGVACECSPLPNRFQCFSFKRVNSPVHIDIEGNFPWALSCFDSPPLSHNTG